MFYIYIYCQIYIYIYIYYNNLIFTNKKDIERQSFGRKKMERMMNLVYK